MLQTILITIGAIYVVSFIAVICMFANVLFVARERSDTIDPADKNRYR